MRIETIGDAVLYHGDCREILSGLPKVDVVITDPPYNVKKDYGTASDDLPPDEYLHKMASVIEMSSTARQCWVAPRYKMREWLTLLPNAHIVVVRRGAGGPFRQGFSDQFVTVLITGNPYRCVPDLWDGIRLKGEGYFFREETYGHPGYTPYPIFEKCVDIMTHPGDVVLEPFMGTGTCGVACVNLQRKFIGIEIDEKYFDIACRRIEAAYKQVPLFAGGEA